MNPHADPANFEPTPLQIEMGDSDARRNWLSRLVTGSVVCIAHGGGYSYLSPKDVSFVSAPIDRTTQLLFVFDSPNVKGRVEKRNGYDYGHSFCVGGKNRSDVSILPDNDEARAAYIRYGKRRDAQSRLRDLTQKATLAESERLIAICEGIKDPKSNLMTVFLSSMEMFMSNISEEEWAAGWIGGLEFTLWRRLQESDPQTEDFTLGAIRSLSMITGGWIAFQGDTNGFVPMAQWLTMVEAEDLRIANQPKYISWNVVQPTADEPWKATCESLRLEPVEGDGERAATFAAFGATLAYLNGKTDAELVEWIGGPIPTGGFRFHAIGTGYQDINRKSESEPWGNA